MRPLSLFAIIDHLATHRRKLVLMQGRQYWRVEDLFAQVRADAREGSPHRRAVLDEAFTWSEEDGKIVVRRGDVVVLAEAGSKALE